ncbi:MAG TPA: HAMP domain-containing sensor histidine kinase [Actinomycetota bacterium]|nr:HAMP domain-containing sensor histidine kinase [Actinomycetota bacterium]
MNGTRDRSPDAPLLRRVRWRLILWSGGSTLVLLSILGGLLYWTTAERLRAESVAQLEIRAKSLQPIANMTTSVDGLKNRALLKVTSDAAAPGMLIGGPASGTIAFIVPAAATSGEFGTVPAPSVTQEGPTAGGSPFDRLITAQLSPSAISAAIRGETTIEERDINGAPFRILTVPVDMAGERFVVGVIGDRTAELNTLQTLLVVLLGGGLAVLAGAVVLGYVYAGRALVPIRESLRRQREFAADASHELRTPLAIVAGATEELRRSANDPAATARAADDIEAGTTRLTGLVDDLLFLARADSDVIELSRAPLDLGEVGGEALARFDGIARERGVRLRLDVEPAPVEGDEARLRQLVGILVDNAIRHSPSDGAVTLRVRRGARLEVEDEGPGLREVDLPHVFQRFWRAPDAPPGGTGLGLAIADWIVRSHGGRIQAANGTSGGARFTVTLPA